MNYTETKQYLKQISKSGSVYGLDTIFELLRRLDHPQNDLKFIHIAGTNGKGSVLAYLSTILTHAGYRIGRYISPQLITYRETIQVNGEYINKPSMATLMTRIKQASEQMEQEGFPTPTYFEVSTALAFLYFKEQNCDYVVLETGLGGLLDATNVVQTTIAEIFVSISLDHIRELGDTIEKIALEKAGIIKPNTKVISANQPEAAKEILMNVSNKQNCEIQFVDEKQIEDVQMDWPNQSFSYKQWKNMKISLAGSYQIKNAALVLETVEVLRGIGLEIRDEDVIEGLAQTSWWGRFTCISKEPIMIVDGAHNEAASKELATSLQQYFNHRRIFYIFGVFKDKEYKKIIQMTAPLAWHIITVQTPNNPRALNAQVLKEEVSKVNSSVEAASSIEQALQQVSDLATPDDVIVIFGSLSFLGEVKKIVLEGEKNG